MRKITWDWMSVELTRKCQLKCRHCYRGLPQDKTISTETLDNWLKQTEVIGLLHFAGGEPTLALEKMEYILDKLYEYCIPLFKLNIVTNGYEKSERFVEIVKGFSEIIKISNMFETDFKVNENITIGVSCDRYHTEQGYNPMEAVAFYKEQLKGYANVTQLYDGNLPYAEGNGKFLDEAICIDFESKKIPRKIEYLTKDHKPMCPYGRTYNLVHENQIYVVCEMYMDVNGRMLTYDKSQKDYVTNDGYEAILNINTTEDILTDIEKFNDGKMCCLDTLKLTKKEQFSSEMQSKVIQELLKSDKALKAKGFEGSNAYNSMVDTLANKHVFGKSNTDGIDESMYINISTMTYISEEEIEKYKAEILEDDEVYSYAAR